MALQQSATSSVDESDDQVHIRADLDRPEEDLVRRQRAAQADDHDAEVRDTAAKADDDQASARDNAATRRDEVAEAEAEDAPVSTVRRHARQDREASASDRASASSDRGRARGDRTTAYHGRVRANDDRNATAASLAHLRQLIDKAEDSADDMLLIGQAQEQLMHEQSVSAPVALITVAVRAIHDETGLSEAARTIISDDPPERPNRH